MSPRGAGPDQPKRAAPGKPPVVGVEKVICACGHETDLPLFDDRRDRLYRDVRRKKLAAGPCPDCRRQGHAELTARQQAEAAQRKAARPSACKTRTRSTARSARQLQHRLRLNDVEDHVRRVLRLRHAQAAEDGMQGGAFRKVQR